jgi:hypothetical protein
MYEKIIFYLDECWVCKTGVEHGGCTAFGRKYHQVIPSKSQFLFRCIPVFLSLAPHDILKRQLHEIFDPRFFS